LLQLVTRKIHVKNGYPLRQVDNQFFPLFFPMQFAAKSEAEKKFEEGLSSKGEGMEEKNNEIRIEAEKSDKMIGNMNTFLRNSTVVP